MLPALSLPASKRQKIVASRCVSGHRAETACSVPLDTALLWPAEFVRYPATLARSDQEGHIRPAVAAACR